MALEDAREKATALARERDAALAEVQALRAALTEERASLTRRIATAPEQATGDAAETVQVASEELQDTAEKSATAKVADLSSNKRLEATVAMRTTGLAKAIAGLRQDEERLRIILDSAADYAIFAMDLQRHIISWNAGAERLLGWSADEILGQNADRIFTPEDQAAGAPEVEAGRALAEGRATNERWHQRKDGSRFWGSGLMMPLQDSAVGSGEPPLGLLKVMRDQTEKQQAEEALRESEARWRGVFEHMHEGFALCEMVTNPEGEASDFRYLEVNDAWERLTGVPAAATVGRLVSEVFPGIGKFWVRTYRQVVETGEPAHFEQHLVC